MPNLGDFELEVIVQCWNIQQCLSSIHCECCTWLLSNTCYVGSEWDTWVKLIKVTKSVLAPVWYLRALCNFVTGLRCSLSAPSAWIECLSGLYVRLKALKASYQQQSFICLPAHSWNGLLSQKCLLTMHVQASTRCPQTPPITLCYSLCCFGWSRCCIQPSVITCPKLITFAHVACWWWMQW